jgi:hypothetical protein
VIPRNDSEECHGNRNGTSRADSRSLNPKPASIQKLDPVNLIAPGIVGSNVKASKSGLVDAQGRFMSLTPLAGVVDAPRHYENLNKGKKRVSLGTGHRGGQVGCVGKSTYERRGGTSMDVVNLWRTFERRRDGREGRVGEQGQKG